MNEFRKCVKRYKGNFNIQTFSCLDQFLCMAFAQLTYRESLRDIEACLRSMQNKLYHMGIRGKVSRSTLSDANEKRDWRIYADFAQVLIHIARILYINDEFGVESVCPRFYNHRPLSFSISLGTVSQTKRSSKTAYTP